MSTGDFNITDELDGLNKTSTLTIEPTNALDTANYSCRAVNGIGERESEQTEVVVFGMLLFEMYMEYSCILTWSKYITCCLFYTVGAEVEFPVEGQQLRVNVPEDFFMTCSASGLPPPSISFFRGSETLEEGSGMSGMGMDFASRTQLGVETTPVLMNDGTFLVTRSLTLTGAVDEDSGNLTCQATNTITELSETRMDSVVFELIVQSKNVVMLIS